MRLGGLSYQSGTENRYRYNGKEYHKELDLGLYDYGFRWYDPAVARFISVDPLAEDFPHLATYQYAANTPIWATDLDGTEPDYTNNEDPEEKQTRNPPTLVTDKPSPRGSSGTKSTSSSVGGFLYKAAGAFVSFMLSPIVCCQGDQPDSPVMVDTGIDPGEDAEGSEDPNPSPVAPDSDTDDEDDIPTYELDAQRFPNIAENVYKAINEEGKPDILTRTPWGYSPINRREAKRGLGSAGYDNQGNQLSWDEYPFASTFEGGAGARVTKVHLRENKAHGGNLNGFYTKNNITTGKRFRVKVINRSDD